MKGPVYIAAGEGVLIQGAFYRAPYELECWAGQSATAVHRTFFGFWLWFQIKLNRHNQTYMYSYPTAAALLDECDPEDM